MEKCHGRSKTLSLIKKRYLFRVVSEDDKFRDFFNLLFVHGKVAETLSFKPFVIGW